MNVYKVEPFGMHDCVTSVQLGTDELCATKIRDAYLY